MKLSASLVASCLATMTRTSSAFTALSPPAAATLTMKRGAAPVLVGQTSSLLHSAKSNNDNEQDQRKLLNPQPVLVSALEKLLMGGEEDNKPVAASIAMTSTLLLALMLMFASPDAAWAARTGGRMGGSFGSAARAPVIRNSAPSRSYGGGSYYYGGGGGYRSGGGGVTVAPIITPSPIITPYYGYGGGYYGGAGVLAPWRGPSFFDVLFFGGVAFVLFNFVTSAVGSVSDSIAGVGTPDGWRDVSSSVLGKGATVAQLSVALEVPNRDDGNSILSVLDRLAQTSRTDSRVGIQNLTSQVALELLRRKSSIVSAYTTSQHFNDKSKAQRGFTSKAIQERGKFEQETVSRYGGVDYSAAAVTAAQSSSSPVNDKATMAVVTMVIAIDGDQTKLPGTVRSMSDVEDALRRIAADATVEDCLQSAEILWTPEDRSETLTRQDVIADYPELRSI